jgi:hypothetical protein
MKKILVILFGVVFGLGCSTAQKERREARDRVASQTGLLCDFVNESDYKDVDVELNLRMGNKCNSAKPFSVSGYKRMNESSGFMYCCSLREGATSSAEASRSSNAPVQSEQATEGKTKEGAKSGKE